MSSILTNNSAMVALQTLKSVNANLADTQNAISTGKSVATARDNAAVWAISKVMDSDVESFKGISDALSLGQSTVSVARQAAETVTDLLTQMKGRIVAAQEENVDRSKIQTDIEALRDQIGSVVSAAQFNGTNLLDGSSTDPMRVLASLDRDVNGNVTASRIDVDRQNLSVTAPASAVVFGTTEEANNGDANAIFELEGASALAAQADYDDIATNGTAVADGADVDVTVQTVQEGQSYQITLADLEVNVVGGGTTSGDREFTYVASATDGTSDVASALANQMNAFFGAATGAGDYTATLGTGTDSNVITIANASGEEMQIAIRVTSGGTPGASPAAEGLGALQNIDVVNNATAALSAIDTMIDQAIDASAAFGSVQGRMDTQSDFVSKLTDSLKSGIGSLVDADMEEASARLQALQVQQQLSVQALSIANQAPQTILSLFR